jgi:c-di-GMP-binding flagellar brake protein YcgR
MPQSKYVGTERRRFVRIPFWFVTKYRVYPHDVNNTEEFRQGIGKNISAGGVCFEANDRFNTGSCLELEIDMPALAHSVTLIGKVAWINSNNETNRNVYGLEFLKIDTRDLNSVKAIIETFA